MYLAQYKSLNKKQFCEMNEVNEQKLFFVMIYDVLNTLFKWVLTNVIYTTHNKREIGQHKLRLIRQNKKVVSKQHFAKMKQ